MIVKGFTPQNGVKVFAIMGAGPMRGLGHAEAADRPRSIVADHANDVTAPAGRDTPETHVTAIRCFPSYAW